MSKNILAVQSSININKENFNDAFKALQSTLITEHSKRVGNENKLLWIDIRLVQQTSGLAQLLEVVQWIPSFNKLNDIDGIDTRINKIGEEDLIFNALAPFIEDGSTLNIIAEDDALEYDSFRYIFTDNKFIDIGRKAIKKKLENGRQRYEANLMSMEDCSKMTTQQALKIKNLKEKLLKYEEPFDSNKLVSGDVGNNIGYLEGHAWIGRVKANTIYEILVIEKQPDTEE